MKQETQQLIVISVVMLIIGMAVATTITASVILAPAIHYVTVESPSSYQDLQALIFNGTFTKSFTVYKINDTCHIKTDYYNVTYSANLELCDLIGLPNNSCIDITAKVILYSFHIDITNKGVTHVC